uniref:Polycomb protein SUZ12-like zinc finger domain-containing protein n=1 Tax=Arundo donax TaxID=35708 RepID=A0A0A9DLD6_ARUDO
MPRSGVRQFAIARCTSILHQLLTFVCQDSSFCWFFYLCSYVTTVQTFIHSFLLPVTEDFTCPFCLAKCGSFTGLEYHLVSSHDLFNFHFMVSNKYQCVNVSLKYRTRKNELFPEAVDPRHARFSYFSKYRKPGGFITATEMIVPSNATEMIFASNATEMVRHGHIFTIGSKSVEDAQGYFEDGHVHKENGISVPDVSIDPAQSLHGGNLSPPRVLQFGKTRKLSVDRFDPRNRQLLQNISSSILTKESK